MTEYYSFTYKDLVTKNTLIPAFIINIALGLLFISADGLSLKEYSTPSINNSHSENLTSPSLLNLTSNILCCLIRVQKMDLPYLPVLALALNQSGFNTMHLYVINIDKSIDKQLLLRKIDMIHAFVERVDYITLPDLGEPEPNDAGYSLLDRALTYLYNQYEHSPTACEYVIMMDSGSFYSSELGNRAIPHMAEKKDIIAWNFISRHYRPDLIQADANKNQRSPKIVDTGLEKCLPVELQIKDAPLGSAAFRLAFLQQHKLHYNYLNRSYDDFSHGYFVERAGSLANDSVILRVILFVQ
jgi:hypothetical protein